MEMKPKDGPLETLEIMHQSKLLITENMECKVFWSNIKILLTIYTIINEEN